MDAEQLSLELDALRIALEHARAWQQLHAEQRLRSMDFFLVGAAFLTTAYVTAFPTSPQLAAAAALGGVVISFGFNRMELRCKGLIKRGEEALAPLESRLAQLVGVDSLRMVERAESSMFLTSYARVFGLLHWVGFLGFAVGLIVAMRTALRLA